MVGSHPALSDFADCYPFRDVSLPKYGLSWRLYPFFWALHETSQLAIFDSHPSCLHLPKHLSVPAVAVHQSGSGTLVSTGDVPFPKYVLSWQHFLVFGTLHETSLSGRYSIPMFSSRLAFACSHLALIASDPRRRRRLTWLLSDSATTARPPGSGTSVRQLASSPLPDSDDGEGPVPEPPDSEEADASPKHVQDFC